jgi:lysophospholipase L1-like esterase
MRENIALIAGTIFLVIVFSLAADWILGLFVYNPPLPGQMELVFPPDSEFGFERGEFAYTARINNLGLRERPVSENAPGLFRIAAFGDSFTYGEGVAAEETWLRQAEKLLREKGHNVETINCGKPGAGPDEYARIARSAIPVLKPDLVIIAMLQGDDVPGCYNGVYSFAADRLAGIVRRIYPNTVRAIRNIRYAAAHENLAIRDAFTNKPAQMQYNDRQSARQILEAAAPEQRARYDALEEDVRNMFLDGMLNPFLISVTMNAPDSLVASADPGHPFFRPAIERCAAFLHEIAELARSYGAEAITVSVPYGAYVNEESNRNLRRIGFETPPELLSAEGPDLAIREAAEMADMPFITVTDGFRGAKSETGLYYLLDGHFTAQGHALFARLLAPRIAAYIGDSWLAGRQSQLRQRKKPSRPPATANISPKTKSVVSGLSVAG